MKVQAGIQDCAVKVLSQCPLHTTGSQGQIRVGARLGFTLR